MKKTTQYAIIVLVILVVLVIGWYALSTQAMATAAYTKCTRWKCTDTRISTCPPGMNSSCSNSSLICSQCTAPNNTKDYVVTLLAVGNQNVYTNYNIRLLGVAYQNVSNSTLLSGIFTVNNETFPLRVGQNHTLADMTIFGVTYLYLDNSDYSISHSEFYIQSTYERESAFLATPNNSTIMISLWTSIENSAVFTINNESALLRAGQTKMLSDQTIFGVTAVSLNPGSASFYLQSAYETKSSFLTEPFPAATTINLKISMSAGGCGAGALSCTNWYVPSCSNNILTCSLSGYYCSPTAPSTKCVPKGSCKC